MKKDKYNSGKDNGVKYKSEKLGFRHSCGDHLWFFSFMIFLKLFIEKKIHFLFVSFDADGKNSPEFVFLQINER